MEEKSTRPDKAETVDIIDDIMDYMDVDEDDEPSDAARPQSPQDHPVLGAGKNEKGADMEPGRERETGKFGMNRRTVMIVAAVCAVVLCAAGAVGYKTWSDHETTLAAQECQDAAASADKAKGAYAKLVDGDAATASKTTASQVQDPKTVDALAEELRATSPKTVSCEAGSKTDYEALTTSITKNRTWYESHTKSLRSAVGKVSESKLAKTIADAESLYSSSDGRVQDTATRDALRKAIDAKDETAIGKAVAQVNDSIAAKTKADEEEAQRKAEEEAAQAQAAAEAAAAQAAQQSYSYSQDYQDYSQNYSYSGGSASSGSSESSTSSGTSSGSSGGSSSGPVSGGHGDPGACSLEDCSIPIQH